LTAYLRREGVEVIQRDLNVEVFDALLRRDAVLEAVDLLYRRFGSPQGRPQRGPSPPPDQVEWALRHGPMLAQEVERAAAVMRSEAFFDGPIGLSMFQMVVQALEVISLPFFPAYLNLQTYVANGPVDSSGFLLHGVQDAQHNMFIDLFRRILLPDVIREQPDVVGISIPSMAQMLPGMTAAYLIKAAGLKCHISIGGPPH
jgi:hypothetical protein